MDNWRLAAAAALALTACTQEREQAASPIESKGAQRPSQQETERYIRRSAEEWAAGPVTGDSDVLERILADDYVGVASAGDVRTKAQQLERARASGEPKFVSARVDYVNFRHFGDTVIAQGAETLKWREKKPDLRLIWTDIWMFRDGKWQVVASQDSVRPPDR